MTAIAGIIDELQRAVEGEPWYSFSMREILRDVTAGDAATRPVGGAHSIWELLLHVTAWTRAVHTRVRGEACELEGEGDWPPVHDTSERAWADAFADLQRAQSELIATLRTLGDADLDAGVPNRDYDRRHLLHGLTQHHAYHAGQMSLLKKALRSR